MSLSPRTAPALKKDDYRPGIIAVRKGHSGGVQNPVERSAWY